MRKVLPHDEFHCLGTAVHDLVHGLHFTADGTVQRTRIANQNIRNDLFGRNHAVQTQLGSHGDQLVAVDLCDHLGHRLRGGIAGNQDIFLIHARQGHKRVGGTDTLLQQKLLPCTVAADHHHARQGIRIFQTLIPIQLDQLDGTAARQEHFGKIICRFARAQNHDVSRLLLHQTEHFQELLQFVGRRHQANAVSGTKHEITVRNVSLLPALHGADQKIGIVPLAQVGDLYAVEGRRRF